MGDRRWADYANASLAEKGNGLIEWFKLGLVCLVLSSIFLAFVETFPDTA
mgnify:CR=1 FL=1